MQKFASLCECSKSREGHNYCHFDDDIVNVPTHNRASSDKPTM